MKIAIASDHAGFGLKGKVSAMLVESGHSVNDFGCFSENSCDYPDYSHPLAKAINNHEFDFGITICGSGNGINMVANKYLHVRGALCWKTEIASLARLHNNANVCALPARFISEEEAFEIVKVFLSTEFEGGRHQTRIDKIISGLNA